jgi:hypothetical protein
VVGEVACGEHDTHVGGEKGDIELTEEVQAPGARERRPFSGQSASTDDGSWSRLSCHWCSVRPALTLLFSSLIQIAADLKFTPSESNFDPALNQQTNSFNCSYISRLILKEQGRILSEIWVVFFKEDNVEHMMYGFDDEHKVVGTGHACRTERRAVGRAVKSSGRSLPSTAALTNSMVNSSSGRRALRRA